jgi:ABC-type multidrug transport system permease subunit
MLARYATATVGTRPTSTPTIQLLTNVRSGSVGVSMATSVAEPALLAITGAAAKQLEARSGGSGVAKADVLRDEPGAVTVVPFRPLPTRSALGLSAFYVSLLTLLCGFLDAVLVNSGVDAALGYSSNEIGTKWQQRAPARITRWQTLLAKWIMAVFLGPLLTGLLLIVALVVLNMDASHVAILWLFCSFAAVVVAGGTLTLFAALGSLGQVVAMLVFIYLALASSGGTIPLQALPSVLRFAANFEPLRQILDGVRAILYFNAAGDAGLTRGLIMTSVGFVIWLAAGIAITSWYDRKGMYRMRPDLLTHINESFREYAETSEPATPTSGTPSS